MTRLVLVVMVLAAVLGVPMVAAADFESLIPQEVNVFDVINALVLERIASSDGGISIAVQPLAGSPLVSAEVCEAVVRIGSGSGQIQLVWQLADWQFQEVFLREVHNVPINLRRLKIETVPIQESVGEAMSDLSEVIRLFGENSPCYRITFLVNPIFFFFGSDRSGPGAVVFFFQVGLVGGVPLPPVSGGRGERRPCQHGRPPGRPARRPA